MSEKIYRVVIIEPSPIIEHGLRYMIESQPNFRIVGLFSDTNRIVERLIALRVDVVVINPTVIDYHHRTSIKSVISDVTLVGLISTHTSVGVLRQFQGVIGIDDDQSDVCRKLTDAVSEGGADASIPDMSDLSDREREILVAVAKGMMNKEIAALHNISIHTVISHRKNISRKTGIRSASGLAVYALLNNLIEQSEIQ